MLDILVLTVRKLTQDYIYNMKDIILPQLYPKLSMLKSVWVSVTPLLIHLGNAHAWNFKGNAIIDLLALV